MNRINSLVLLVLLMASCGNSKNNSEIMYDMQMMEKEESMPVTRQMRSEAPNNPPAQKDNALQYDGTEKKIIKDGTMGIRVSNLEKSKAAIDSLLSTHRGYYSNERFNNTDHATIYNLIIRLPAGSFELFIKAIESGKHEVLYKSIAARDVTDQFIDLESRLQNKREYLSRYQQLLKKAASIKDILEIQEKIRVLEEEIESTTGRLKYLNDQVDYSTLSLEITKRKEFTYDPVERDKFMERLKQSISRGWYGFVDFILLLVKTWPFWLIIATGIILWKRYRQKR